MRYFVNLLVKSANTFSFNQIIEVENGSLIRAYAFEKEIENTVVLQGVVLLSSQSTFNLFVDSFADLIKQLTSVDEPQHVAGLHPFLLTGVDVSRRELLSGWQLTRL